MNNSHASETRARGLIQVFFNYTFYISRLDGVQIENIGDLNVYRFRERIEGVGKCILIVFRFTGDGRSLPRNRITEELCPKVIEAHWMCSSPTG